MTKAQLADFAADAVALAKEHADRAGGMAAPPGHFAVTIRVERPDGQFATSSRLVPDSLLSAADQDGAAMQDWAVREVGAGFVSAYRRAVELPGPAMHDAPPADEILACPLCCHDW